MLELRLPEFYILEDALVRIDASFSAAEAQGMACAVLAFNNQFPLNTWQQTILKDTDRNDFYVKEAGKLLNSVYTTTLEQLNSNDLNFDLLLPDEQAGLDVQAVALQKWCQGFAYGLALSGLKTMQDLPSDTRDWVQDVIKIGSAGELDTEDEEESEAALMELAEFLRMGVLMMNEELQPVRGQADLSTLANSDTNKD